MKLVRFEYDGIERSGLLDGTSIVHETGKGLRIEDMVTGDAEATRRFARLARGGPECDVVAVDTVRLLAPLASTPNNIFCVGLNYQEHVDEGVRLGETKPVVEAPTFFTKPATTIAAPNGPIAYWTKVTQKLDYEVELAVVIGKTGRDIAAADAMDHVFGYCVANDVSARDVQFRHGQWFRGKALDGSLPLGPSLVTRDEVADPRELVLTLTVNGVARQRASVAQMIFDIPTIIESLSAGLTLCAGDIILTGTPSGVGVAMEPPVFLDDGDEVECSITQLGSLRNRVTAMVC